MGAPAEVWSARPSVSVWQLCGAYPASRAQTGLSPVQLCSCLAGSVLSVASFQWFLPCSLSSRPSSPGPTAPLKSSPFLSPSALLHFLLSLLLPQSLPPFPVLRFTVPSASLGCGVCVHRPIPSLCRPLLHLSPTPHFSCKDFGHVLLLGPAEWRAFPSVFF